jgi:hypothetical protein
MKNAAYIFFPMLIVAACFLAGCSSSPPSDTATPAATHTPVNVGMTASTVEEEYRNFSFEEVTDSISALGFDPYIPPSQSHGTNQTVDKHIMLIRGDHLDENARATSWLFIVRHDNKTAFVTYDHLGETVMNWGGSYPKEEIFPDQVVPPKTLFDQNRAEIFKGSTVNDTDSRMLELTGGNYTLTITGQGAPRILVFDAKSGALRSSK